MFCIHPVQFVVQNIVLTRFGSHGEILEMPARVWQSTVHNCPTQRCTKIHKVNSVFEETDLEQQEGTIVYISGEFDLANSGPHEWASRTSHELQSPTFNLSTCFSC